MLSAGKRSRVKFTGRSYKFYNEIFTAKRSEFKIPIDKQLLPHHYPSILLDFQDENL